MKKYAVVYPGISINFIIGTFIMWGGLPLSSLTGLELPEILKFWSVPLLLSIGITLLFAALVKINYTQCLALITTFCSGIFCLTGFGLLLFFRSLNTTYMIVVLSAVLEGLGYGLSLLLIQRRLSSFSNEVIVKILLISLAICSLSYLVLQSLISEIKVFVFPVLIVFSLALNGQFVKQLTNKEQTEESNNATEGLQKDVFLTFRNLLFCVGSLAIAVALTRAIALDGLENSEVANIIASFAVIASSLLLYFIWFGPRKRIASLSRLNILGLYRIFFPLIATALLLLSLLGTAWSLVVTTIAYAAYVIVAALIISTSISLSKRYRISAFRVYAAFAGAVYFIFGIATTIAPLIYFPQNFGTSTATVIVLLVFYLMAMSYVVIQNREGKEDQLAKQENRKQTNDPIIIDVFTQQISSLSKEKSLTPRETEILHLLSRGRDVPNIAKQLFISENTVRSHSKNVYRKLDVHSRQEILDLLEMRNFSSEKARSGLM